ncbi:hypothetical protein J6590_004591 [Homalodisca vitripennis]|nr:hypothetical protein J6590_004591 [Homalodisca vitripennis]
MHSTRGFVYYHMNICIHPRLRLLPHEDKDSTRGFVHYHMKKCIHPRLRLLPHEHLHSTRSFVHYHMKICIQPEASTRRYGFNPRLRLLPHEDMHSSFLSTLMTLRFISRKVRDEWLTAARGRKNINASDVDPALINSPVFINEHLTPHNKAILGRARRLQREKKITFAGFFNGKILVKVSEGAETERITSLSDLDKFDQ